MSSATGRLQDLYDMDKQLGEQLKDLLVLVNALSEQIHYVSTTSVPLSEIMGLDQLERESEDTYKHPTDQLIIVKRFADKWRHVEESLNFSGSFDSMRDMHNELKAVRQEEREAFDGIFRLSLVYGIPARNFSQGTILNHKSKLHLKLQDLFDASKMKCWKRKKY